MYSFADEDSTKATLASPKISRASLFACCTHGGNDGLIASFFVPAILYLATNDSSSIVERRASSIAMLYWCVMKAQSLLLNDRILSTKLSCTLNSLLP